MQQPPWAGTKLRAAVPAAVALVLLAAALAGCAHAGDDEPRIIERDPPRDRDTAAGIDDDEDAADDNETAQPQPMAPPPLPPLITLDLNATLKAGWAGEDAFVLQATTDVENGNATRWHFDFGDGASVTIEAPEEPSATHTFEAGGAYTVKVTVEAEGAGTGNDSLAATATESLVVYVHERHAIPAGSLASMPVIGPVDMDEVPFPVAEGAVHVRAVVNVTNTGVTSAGGNVLVLDPAGELVAESGFSVPMNEAREVIAGHALDNTTGEHMLRIQLSQGEVDYSGTVEVYYGVAPEA